MVGAPGTTPARAWLRKAPGIAGDVEVAPNGDLIFADTRRGVIHRFDVAALNEPVRARSVVVDTDERQVLFSDWRIDSPTSVSIGPDGDYAADARHNRVTRIDDSGDMSLPGTGIRGFDGDLKPAFRQPERPQRHRGCFERGRLYRRFRQQSDSWCRPRPV